MPTLKKTGLLCFALLACLGWLLAFAVQSETRDDYELGVGRQVSSEKRPALPIGEAPLVAAERSAAAGTPAELSIRLHSSCTPISRLSIVLEDEAGQAPLELSIRDTLTLHNFAPGRYVLRSAEANWTSAPVHFEFDSTMRASQVDLAIESEGAWTGSVVDLQTGVALAAAKFSWSVRGELGGSPFEGDFGPREIRLERGRFSVGCGGFLGRSSAVRIEAEGYLPFTTPWIEFDGRVGIELGDIGLMPSKVTGLALGGRIVEAGTQRPLKNVRVTAVPLGTQLGDLWVHGSTLQGAEPLGELVATSDEQGGFELDLRGPDLVQLAAFCSSHGLMLSEPVPCRPGVTLEMKRRASLRGRVVTSEEVLAAGALNGVLVTGAGTTTVLTLDQSLGFELGGLAPGRVRVALQVLERQTAGQNVCAEVAVQSLDLRDGEVSEIELRYGVDPVQSGCSGRVLLPPGVEFSTMRAALWAEGEPAPSHFAVIDLDGQFELHDTPGAKARLYVGGSSADSSRGFVAMRELNVSPSSATPEAIEFDVRSPRVRGKAWIAGAAGAHLSVIVTPSGADAAWVRAVAEGLSISTDEQGSFEIFGLMPGDYEIGRLGGGRQVLSLTGKEIGTTELRLE